MIGRKFAPRAGALIATVAVLAGCALVDDARRELGPEPDGVTRAGAGRTTPPPSPAASASASAFAPPSATGGCPPSGVLVQAGDADAAMGLRAMGVHLVNCGSVPVTLNGYPGVRLLDRAGAALPVTVVQGTSGVASIEGFDTPPAPVTAAPGERLEVGLVWRNTVTDTTVDPVNGVFLEIVPAPGQPPQVVRPDGPVDVGTTGRLGVTAWRPARR